MKSLPKQNILYSDKILTLAKHQAQTQQQGQNFIIDASQYQYITPRIFPNSRIPAKVAIFRKIKMYHSVDINQVLKLKNKDWNVQGEFRALRHYVFNDQYVTDVGCSDQNINEGKVRGRAYCMGNQRYQPFLIKSYDRTTDHFTGTFIIKSTSSKTLPLDTIQTLHRSMICFDFQDPIPYCNAIQQALARRKKVFQIIQYQFYVDNMDLQGAPMPSHKIINKIKQLAMLYCRDVSLTQEDMLWAVNHYKRVMNQILFRHQVLVQNLPIYLPTKYNKKIQSKNHLLKKITVKKSNKTITLLPKSTKQKLQDFKRKTLFINNNITYLVLYLQQKLSLKPQCSLFLPQTATILQKYIVDQLNQFEYSYTSINQFVVDPLSAQIRNKIKEESDGWFRNYQDSRGIYYQSKLRRLFVMLNNVLRDWTVDQLEKQYEKYLEFISKWTPEQVNITTLHQNTVKMPGEKIVHKIYMHVIAIQLVLDKGKLKLSHSPARVNTLLKRLITQSLQKFQRIPSPEPIVLKQLFGGYKNQQGIKIQLPIHENNQTQGQSCIRYPKIKQLIHKINIQIDKICQPLTQYQKIIDQTAQKICLDELIQGKKSNSNKSGIMSIKQIVKSLKQLQQIQYQLRQLFQSQGTSIGFFYINYQLVKAQINQLIKSQSQLIRRKLIAQNRRVSTIYYQRIKQLQQKLTEKPKTVQQLIQKQKLMNNLSQALQQPNRKQLMQVRTLCAEFGCRVQGSELKKEIQMDKVVYRLYHSQDSVTKEFQTMKKQQLNKIQAIKADIQQSLKLLHITKDSLSSQTNPQNYLQYSNKIRYITNNMHKFKIQAAQIYSKQLLLQIQNPSSQLIDDLFQFQKQFQKYQLLWLSVQDWKNASNIWMNQPIGSYQLKQPQLMLKNMGNNLKKATFMFNSNQQSELQAIAENFRKQIQQFQPKLQLLRLLKKKGLSKKHLQQIGIYLNTQIDKITLTQAIQLGLFDKLSQIQAISNDAWNQFSLQQTLQRLLSQIYSLKFNLNSYKDRKNNDILIIINYKQLIQSIDSILTNIQSVQFNPMVKLYQPHIKQIYQKTTYISNSVIICQQFQKVLVQLHPVFDATDIVKQIPAENKKFAKVLRVWLELMVYVKSITSVHDACGSQNIYQKVKGILNSIQNVKKELINYLQQKRKGFSRFYLLSNSQMFQLFSATSDINLVNSLIPKLFDTVTKLNIDHINGTITGVYSDKQCFLQFTKPVLYKSINIQNWLNSLQKQINTTIKSQISNQIQKSITNSNSAGVQINWLEIVQDQNMLPQVVYVLCQIMSTMEIFRNLQRLDRVRDMFRKILAVLVNRKQNQKQNRLNKKSNIILCSLIILISSKLSIIQNLSISLASPIKLSPSIQTPSSSSLSPSSTPPLSNTSSNTSSFTISTSSILHNFQLKKLIKTAYIVQSQKYNKSVIIQTLNYQSQYGYQFLGVYDRLVITNLTQKMQIVYFMAQKYSLGGAAVGPAGTGKSQTTKDIAKIVGKNCLIYNCSQNFDHSTFVRLIKGLVISGLWICFDQFNRLNYKILSIAAQQLSYLLKFRSYGHRIQLSLQGEPIWLDPSFQICITYNATYKNRQNIPKNLNELFRTVALILPDELTICQALLYSNGYARGDQLAIKIVNVLKKCREIWTKEQIYDFGLRALRGIINMAAKIFLQGKQNQEYSIIEALKILNSPKMKKDDNELFISLISKQFNIAAIIKPQNKNKLHSQKLEIFTSILSIRDGILLIGQPLSGKQMVLQQFKEHFPQWQVSTVFHDVLTVDELYGELDSTTKLWRDGFFTSLIRNNVNESDKRKKYAVVLNGSVYSQWVQNLNSFLDSTRKLSLSSGQTISIPPTLKLVVSCTDLLQASPATITRFGIIKNQPLQNAQIAKRHSNFPKKLLNLYQQIEAQIKNEFLASLSSRQIFDWTIEQVVSGPVNYDTFIFYLAQIYDGLLSDNGKQKFTAICKKYQSVPCSPFEFMLKLNGQPTLIASQFNKFKKYQQLNSSFVTQAPIFEQIFVPTLRSYKLTHLIQSYLSAVKNKKNGRIFMLIGEQNIGKSRIVKQFLMNNISKQRYKLLSLFFTRNTTCKNCYQQLSSKLTKKTSNKLGGDPGISMNIWIQDFNMPTTNKFDIIQTSQLLRLICSQKQWYNYHSLSKEHLEDLVFLCDAKTNQFGYKNPLGVSPRLYRYLHPVFCSNVGKNQLQFIFKQIVHKCLGKAINNEVLENYTGIINKAIQFYWILKDQEIYAKNILQISLGDLYRTLKGFLAWKLPENINVVSQVFQYELSRNIVSKISKKEQKSMINMLILEHFMKQSTSNTPLMTPLTPLTPSQNSQFPGPQFSSPSPSSIPVIPLFHNLQSSNISLVKCQKIQNISQFASKFQCICDQYRTLNNQTRSLIIFPELLTHLIKIYRSLMLDYSHTGICGMSKCGKNTIVKLASYLISSDLYYIRESNQHQEKQWQQGVKNATKMCYKNKNVSLLVIKSKNFGNIWCLEDINKLLNTMHLPNIYSEADIEQLTYMMQAELVRKNLPINKQSMWSEYIKYLKQKLRIVFLLNPTFEIVKTSLTQYPSIVKLCTFFYIDKWPTQALYLIAKSEMADLGYSLDILPEIHQYCQKMCQNSKLSILNSIWEGMYFDFIALFTQIFQRNKQQLNVRKNQYEQSRQVIRQTQDQLEKTKNKIKKLQPTIIMIQNQTSKTVRNLQIQRKNAQQTNISLHIKNEQAEKIIKQSRVLKAELEVKVAAVNIKIAKAWQNVSLLKTTHISQVKVLTNPSDFIRTVLAALVILTYDGPLVKQVRDNNGQITVQDSYFETAKKHVLSRDAKTICRMLIQFKRQNVTKQMFERLQDKCLSYKRWNQKQAKSANKAIYYFFLWAEAVASQYRIFVETQPLRDQLDKITQILQKKQAQIGTIRKQLQFYQAKIVQYETQHKIKKQALQQYRLQIRKFQRMLTRGHELLKQISGQQQKWGNYIKQINHKMKHNFGDSIIMASTIVYLSPHVYQLRKKVKQHISKLCKKKGIPCMVTGLKSCELPWYISKQEQQLFLTLQLHQNQFLIDNIKIAENTYQSINTSNNENNNNNSNLYDDNLNKSTPSNTSTSPTRSNAISYSKVVLLIDPQQQGIKLIRKLLWQKIQAPIDKISQYSSNLTKCIQSAILYGRIVFVQVDASHYNNLLRFVITPSISTVDGIRYIKASGDKLIPIHDNYRIYFYTTVYPQRSTNNNNNNTSVSYSMELLTNLQIINFKMTMEQLQQKILQIIINVQLPMLKAKIQEILRVNIKDTLTLTNIQEKLLTTFSSRLSSEQILQNDQILNTVIHSNRLYKQISARILQSKQQQQQIEIQKRPFRKKANEACLLYQNIQRLKLVHIMYSFSYHWFIDLFQNNVYNFNVTLYQQVSKALKQQQKIVAAILIAQILQPSLPWRCLFNVQQNLITKTIYTTHQQQQENDDQLRVSQVSVNMFDKVMGKIGRFVKKLPVSQAAWNAIVVRIDQVKKYLPTLEDNFNQQPQMFGDMILLPQQRIFQAIPNQYSHLDFFYKILLVSCFRPQCVISLLRQWLKINLGTSYIQTTRPLSSLASNTRPYRPIITLLPDTSIQSLHKIRQIYRQLHPKLQTTSMPISHFHFQSLNDAAQFDTMIKSTIAVNGWLVVQSVNSVQITTYIKDYFQEFNVLSDKEFRLWIVMLAADAQVVKSGSQGSDGDGEGGFQIGERFSQFCDKVRIVTNKQIYKEISASFTRYQQMLISQTDFFQRNKKKMMISQLCILHHLLSQFSDKYTQLSQISKSRLNLPISSTSLLTLTQWDLKLLLQQTSHYKLDQFCKYILQSQLISELAYGSQLTSSYLNKLLYYNSQYLIDGIVTERSVFFQSLWCQEKFPRDSQEYEHQVRNIVIKKKYREVFGIGYQLQYQFKVNQYQSICKFYQRTVFASGKGVTQIILDRLNTIRAQIIALQQSASYTSIPTLLNSLKSNPKYSNATRYKNIYHFCRLQYQTLQNLLYKITSDIIKCEFTLTNQLQIPKNTPLQLFMLRIYSNNSPWSQSQRPILLNNFIQNFKRKYQNLCKYLQQFDHVLWVTQADCWNNWNMFLDVFKHMWQYQPINNNNNQIMVKQNNNNNINAKQQHRFVFIALDSMEKQKLKEQLKLLGFEHPGEKSDYPEQIIHNQYGQKMELMTIFKQFLLQLISQLQITKSKQYGIIGYTFLTDLSLLNSQLQHRGNYNQLKFQITKQDVAQNVTLLKSIMNLAVSLKSLQSYKNKTGSDQKINQTLKQEKVNGILLIVNDWQHNNSTNKNTNTKTILDLLQQQYQNNNLNRSNNTAGMGSQLIAVPCYQYAMIDISNQCEPVTMLYTLVRSTDTQKELQGEIVRRNIHFCFKP